MKYTKGDGKMADVTSLNSTEYTYEQKSEGKVKRNRVLMILFYVLFAAGFFALCLAINIFLFAIGPLLVYIIYLCTWRLVKYDCYWEFGQGHLEVGKVKVNKHGRIKVKKLSIHVKEALDIGHYTARGELDSVKRVHDYSESQSSENRIYIVYLEDGRRTGLIIEGTARLANLLTSFCPNAHDIKGKPFHG